MLPYSRRAAQKKMSLNKKSKYGVCIEEALLYFGDMEIDKLLRAKWQPLLNKLDPKTELPEILDEPLNEYWRTQIYLSRVCEGGNNERLRAIYFQVPLKVIQDIDEGLLIPFNPGNDEPIDPPVFCRGCEYHMIVQECSANTQKSKYCKEECWNWPGEPLYNLWGRRFPQNIAYAGFRGKPVWHERTKEPHEIAAETFEHILVHLCANPSCCRPQHLILRSLAEQVKKVLGNEEMVKDIKEMLKDGIHPVKIANKFDVDLETINSLVA